MFSSLQNGASNFVHDVDRVFLIIYGFAFVFLLAITALIVIFIIKYRKEKHPKAEQISGNLRLEVGWFIGSIVLVLVLFHFGWEGYRPMKHPPKEGMKIKTVARMWQWQWVYDNGKVTDTLFVPADTAVILDLVSLDVIHSLYIPEFRLKEDVVPGREKTMWFIPEYAGIFDIFCAEYCGLQHSYMRSSVHVMSKEEFKNWFTDTSKVEIPKELPPSQAGYMLLQKNGCVACHTTDGSKLVGPSYLGVYGSDVTVRTNGVKREIIADDSYIKRSILTPDADIVDGFNKGLMLSYKDMVSDEDIKLIIEYLKTLQE